MPMARPLHTESPIRVAASLVIDTGLFEAARAPRDKRAPQRNPGRTGSTPLLLAGLLCCAAWLRQLETGEVVSRAAIAWREGLSRARVTQILNRLDATVVRRQLAG